MNEIRFRRGSLTDIDTIIHHRVQMFADMGAAPEETWPRLQAMGESYFREALASGTYLAWLAESGSRVVGGGGIVLAGWPGSPWDNQSRRAWILNMYVEPEFRRRGIARELMQLMLAWCRSEGLAIVNLHASREGRALYESLGFKPTNEMRLKLREPEL